MNEIPRDHVTLLWSYLTRDSTRAVLNRESG
jgi:hypothetical protein